MPGAVSSPLAEHVASLGLEQYAVPADGACQFRSIAHYAKGDQSRFEEVRRELRAHFAASRPAPFSPSYPESDRAAVRAALAPGSREWGDHYTLSTAAQLYGLRFHVITADEVRSVGPDDGADAWLAYSQEPCAQHYNPAHPPKVVALLRRGVPAGDAHAAFVAAGGRPPQPPPPPPEPAAPCPPPAPAAWPPAGAAVVLTNSRGAVAEAYAAARGVCGCAPDDGMLGAAGTVLRADADGTAKVEFAGGGVPRWVPIVLLSPAPGDDRKPAVAAGALAAAAAAPPPAAPSAQRRATASSRPCTQHPSPPQRLLIRSGRPAGLLCPALLHPSLMGTGWGRRP